MTDFQDYRKGVFWLYGLSGAGKSTLATEAAKALRTIGQSVVILDGDKLRLGLCRDLGFSPEDRLENVRRTAELAKVLCEQGVIVIAALMTPHENMRQLARGIVGEAHFHEVYVKCDFPTCARRDSKGLYARAANGEITHFPGKDLMFEEAQTPNLVLDTSNSTVVSSVRQLLEEVYEAMGILGSPRP